MSSNCWTITTPSSQTEVRAAGDSSVTTLTWTCSCQNWSVTSAGFSKSWLIWLKTLSSSPRREASSSDLPTTRQNLSWLDKWETQGPVFHEKTCPGCFRSLANSRGLQSLTMTALASVCWFLSRSWQVLTAILAWTQKASVKAALSSSACKWFLQRIQLMKASRNWRSLVLVFSKASKKRPEQGSLTGLTRMAMTAAMPLRRAAVN